MPSLMLHGESRDMANLSVEELQSNIAACQLLFPKWKSGYQVIIAGGSVSGRASEGIYFRDSMTNAR